MKKLAFVFGLLIFFSPVLAAEEIKNFQLYRELIIIIAVLGIIALVVHKLL